MAWLCPLRAGLFARDMALARRRLMLAPLLFLINGLGVIGVWTHEGLRVSSCSSLCSELVVVNSGNGSVFGSFGYVTVNMLL